MLVAFIVGISVHSAVLWWHIPTVVWIGSAIFLTIGIAVALSRRIKIMFLILAACAGGVWRFDVASRPRLAWLDGNAFVIENSTPNVEPFTTLGHWRNQITLRIASVMPRNEAMLVSGMLYGGSGLSKQQKTAFRDAGLMHLVAVSGSNVTVVVQFVALVVFQLRLRRRHGFWVTTFVLAAFVGFVGCSASILRAAFMGWLVLLAREVGRLSSPVRLLMVAATVILLINPWQLAFDVSFGLSFLAMCGLLFWTPLFAERLRWLPEQFSIRETVATTVGATLMTVPYIAWVFHRVTLAGLVTNVLALPLVPFVMLWGVVAAVWGKWFGFQVVAAPAYGLAWSIERIAELPKIIPWFNREIELVSTPILFASYLLLWVLYRQWSKDSLLSTEFTTFLENDVRDSQFVRSR